MAWDQNIKDNGYIAGFKPLLEGAGESAHLVWNDSNNDLHYMVFDWISGYTVSKRLYRGV